MWRILPGLVGQTGVTDLRQSPQGTPLLFPRRHPQLLVISPLRTLGILLTLSFSRRDPGVS
jgi:hypothetical protein